MVVTTLYIQPRAPPSDTVVKLSTVDQLMPRKHMSFLFCFKLEDSADPNTIVSQLRSGLAAALTEVPQFAGEIQQAPGERNELQLYVGPDSSVLFRDRRQWSGPSYGELQAANFSPSLLREEELLVLPDGTITASGGHRCFLSQANFIEGGLLLALQTHHCFTDAKGAEMFVKRWAKHSAELSQGLSLTAEPLDEDALERWRLSYGTKKVKISDFPEFRDSPAQTHVVNGGAQTLADVVPAIWYLSPASLDDLRTLALNGKGSTVNLSKSEALTAFLFRHICQARFGRSDKSTSQPSSATVYVTSDLRSRLEPALHLEYLGNASMVVPVPIAVDRLCSDDEADVLYEIATKIQTAIHAYDTKAVRKIVGLYNSQPAFGTLKPDLKYWPGPNLMIADSSGQSMYSLDWGKQIGQAESFRTIGITMSAGNCSVYPKLRDGGMQIYMRHERKVVEAMRANQDFARFAEVVC